MSSHLVFTPLTAQTGSSGAIKCLSAKHVNNEDLDQQLGPQTLTALVTPSEPIDQGFHAGSARLHGTINRSQLSSRLIYQSELIQ